MTKQGLEFTHDGRTQHIDIEVLPVKSELEDPYFLVTFQPAVPPPETELTAIKDKRVKQLEGELAALREDMRSIIESQEAAVEELQSANEEIVSSNEELQSINEELETSKKKLKAATKNSSPSTRNCSCAMSS